jgi:hypothetical protein
MAAARNTDKGGVAATRILKGTLRAFDRSEIEQIIAKTS